MGYNDKYPDMSAIYELQFREENRLKKEIKDLKKALDLALDALKRIKFRGEHSKYECCKVSGNIAKQALEQITALEQKDKLCLLISKY